MSKQKLTPWFMNGEKPARKGVYRVRSDGFYGFAYWDGRLWAWRCSSVAEANDDRLTTGASQTKHWRGLAHPPKGKP